MDPGPLDNVDPSSIAPFPPAPSFEGIVAGHLEQLAGADQTLASGAAQAITGAPDALEPSYAANIGPAQAGAANEDGTLPPSGVPDALGAGDQNDARRVDNAKYLPDAGAPIEQPFVDPPPAPGDITEPGGVENPPPPQI